jgi:anaerobic magnesium-protoporphyrin IX monomethyl ester cyclase
MKILFGYPNLPMMITPALAVGLFTTICKEENVEIKLFETTPYTDDIESGMLFKSKLGGGRLYSPKDIGLDIKPRSQIIPDWKALVEEYAPDLIFFSTVEDTLKETKEMINVISQLNIPHIVGGVFPINVPDICLASEEINVICRYEGELVVRDVIRAWKNNENWMTVRGLWYKEADRIIKNPLQPLCDINEIIPDYSLYNENRFLRPIGGHIRRAIQLETYRGCPYSCTFCNSPMTRSMDKSFLRRKTMAQVEKELTHYVETYNPDYWYIGDDSFLARPKKEIIEICKIFEKFQIPWWCNTRLENVDEEILQAMKDGYCDRIQFGIESGNEQYRKTVLQRPVDDATYYKKSIILNESNIPYGLNVIIGMPGETREMVFESIRMIKKMKGYDGIGISIFIPYHGTALRQYAIDNGMLDPNWISNDGYLLGGTPLVMPPECLQPDEIWELASTLKYYCFFDEPYWEAIKLAHDNNELDKLDDIYNREFYTPLAQGGKDHIKLRVQNHYACSSDPYVDFNQFA